MFYLGGYLRNHGDMIAFRPPVFLLMLVYLSATSTVCAQELPMRQFTVEDGLPSNDIFGLLFDRNNVLWATTERGVVSYDGYSLKEFTMADGLTDNCNLRIYLSPENEIWVTSIINSVNYIFHDTVRQVPYNKDLMGIVPNAVFVQNMLFDSTSQYITFNNKGLYRSENHKSLELVEIADDEAEGASVCIIEKPGGDIVPLLKLPVADPDHPTKIRRTGDKLFLEMGTSYLDSELRRELIRISPDEFYLSVIDKLIHVKNDTVVGSVYYGRDILALFIDHSGQLWVSVQSDGVYGYENGGLANQPNRILKGRSVTAIAQDHEDRYWFSTIGAGIFMTRLVKLPVFRDASGSEDDHKITALTSDEDGLFFGTYSGRLYSLTIQGTWDMIEELPIPGGSGPVRKIAITPKNTLLLFRDSLMEINRDGSPGYLGNFESYAYDYMALEEGRWLVSKTRNIVEYQDYTPLRSFRANENPSFTNVRHMFLDSRDTIWLNSRTFGTSVWKGNFTKRPAGHSDIWNRRNCGYVETPGSIWFSPTGLGLFRFGYDGSLDTITTANSVLTSDIIDVLFKENDSTIWIGTNDGLNCLCLTGNGRPGYRMRKYTVEEGLPSNDIYSITRYNGEIWVGTNSGLIELSRDFKEISYSVLSPVITDVRVNGTAAGLASSYDLKPYQNTIEVHFKAVSFRDPPGIEYRYMLEGFDKSWMTTRDRVVRYAGVSHGKHDFKLMAFNAGGPEPAEAEALRISFDIERHFYQRFPFIMLMTALGVLILFMIYFILARQIRIRSLEKQRLMLAEKEALLSQMNPHFIFNSLNSIQHYIVEHDTENATKYMSRFSALIRKILDNSRKEEITLAEEIDTLKLYLELEKMRFEDDFDYKLETESGLEVNEIFIPPMLIQPFVENAILHGLTPLEEKGNLLISFNKQGDNVLCVVEDNGIGREKSGHVSKRRRHTPTGLVNIKERIELINKLGNRQMNYRIIDLYNEWGEPAGTRVEIMIPCPAKEL